ncbi:MAG: serine/threonine-protein kinase HipA [Lentisphaeria bacterium]|jgi:serine/threonine-protein kinase HipA
MTTEYCNISLKKLTGKQSKAGYHNGEFKMLFGSAKVNPCLPFSRAEFFQNSKQHILGMSISGVQQKLSLKENEKHELVATAQGGEYILKLSPEAYPNAAENEHAAMQVSRLMGIDTAQCGLVTFEGGERVCIVKRFDRQSNGDKLHQEDLMQCADLPSERKYDLTYEEAGKLVNDVTKGKQVAVLDFVRRVILAYVIGNNDLHLKNISVQRLPDNSSHYYDKLTPNYDCLFCDAFKRDEEGLGYLALGLLNDLGDGEYFTDMYNHYGYYTGYDFLELGRRLDLQERPIRTFIIKLLANKKKIIDVILHSYMPNDMKDRATKLVEARIQAMQIMESNL